MTHRRVLLSLTALLAIMAVGLLSTLSAQAAPPAQNTNLLENPGFEDPFEPFQGDTTRMVALGWSAWHVPQRAGDDGFRNLPPEYQPATAGNPDRVRSGANAQEYFSFFATHTGGVYQQVRVPTGSRVQFSVFAYVWSTDGDDPNNSIEPGRVQIQVGIDPTGGTDGESDQIAWSAPLEYYDEYRQLSAEANADGEIVTVFVRSTFDQPQQHNNVYLDDASLTVMGAALPTNTDQPTDTPIPTDTPQPTNTPEASNTPEPSSTATEDGAFPTPTQDESDATATLAPTTTSTPDFGDEFPTYIIHRVVAGDTVGRLAQRYDSTIEAIIAANGLNADAVIFVNQELIIPVRAQPTPVPPTQPAPQPTNTPTDGTGGPIATYTVQPGDTLTRIAALYNTTVAALSQLNGIVNPNLIRVGQVLRVPSSPPSPQPPQPTATPIPPGPRIHVVQPGENAFRISLRYGVSLEALVRVNNIANANLIYVGQVLTIP